MSYPLATIFNVSMQTGEVTQDWRDVLVCPIYKKGPRTNPSNYQPISLTSFVGKLMEGIIKDSMMAYLVSNNVLTSYQHGLRHHKSIVTTLLDYLNKLTELLDKSHAIDVI